MNKAGAQKRSKSGNRSFTLNGYSIRDTASFHGKRIINVYIYVPLLILNVTVFKQFYFRTNQPGIQ